MAEISIRVNGAGLMPNAVCHATGRRIRDLPITPDKLVAHDRSGR
jgi:CO/xanthine dehydrogenase Mo-binding subunit